VGLSSIKAVVERFGGELMLETRENVGSTFRVRLPLATATPAESDGPLQV
jgi:signal transduction histidine kinase